MTSDYLSPISKKDYIKACNEVLSDHSLLTLRRNLL